jgi:hypothetical protein
MNFLPTDQELAEVRDIVRALSGADPIGELKTAHLTLRTKAISASLEHYLLNLDPRRPRHLILLEDFTISKALECSAPNLYRLETGYLGLSDSRLVDEIESLDVLLAQIASCTGDDRSGFMVWMMLFHLSKRSGYTCC